MSTTASAPQALMSSTEAPREAEQVEVETKVFLKPTFGITVKSSTLSVCVSARPDSEQSIPSAG